MSASALGFTEMFWEHVGPRLTRLCVALARSVAAEVEEYDSAWGKLNRYASKYGASRLPAYQREELADWITTNLSAAIFDAEDAGWDQWIKDNKIGTGARV